MIAQGYLFADMERYGALTLTDRSRPLLRGESALRIKKQAKVSKKPASRSARVAADELSDQDKTLFESLSALRRRLAREQGVPAYIIFHDQTLMAMARERPAAMAEMQMINGVGDSKLARYGEVFLAEIQAAGEAPGAMPVDDVVTVAGPVGR